MMEPPPSPTDDLRPTRRTFLRWGLGGLAGTAAIGTAGHLLSSSNAHESTAAVRTGASSIERRTLVVVELDGGNDGLSTLVPYGDGRYHDLRPTLALDGDSVSGWDDRFGIHHHLAGLEPFSLAALVGVGASKPDLSHFDMQARWWAGMPDGGGSGTGLLGRVCDRLSGDPDDPDAPPLVGVSITTGPSPALAAERAPTASVGGPDGFGLLFQGDDSQNAAARRCIERLAGQGAGDELLGEHRRGLTGVLRIADLLDHLPEAEGPEPPSEFAGQLAFAAQLVTADAGIRVIHVPMSGGTFDTHDGHRDTHEENMRLLGEGLESFWTTITGAGRAGEVLVATTSEFGRRAEEHNGGLDHGTASTMLLMGPVRPGIHGEHPSLSNLDEDGNLIATLEFDRYLATLGSWLGVDAESVYSNPVEPISELLVG